MVELFFDLVFVFAVTQLSHALLAHLTLAGVLQTALLLLAVWWVWIYTSWVTNWLDPEQLPVRICLLVLMLAGLLVSVSIPLAFTQRGLLFAGGYVFMHIGRSLFFLWAVRGEASRLTRNFQRILAWLTLSGVFWIAGGLEHGDTRIALWAVALLVELVAPWLGFWVPGLGRSRTTDWNVEGHHMAERCALFVIIALGESLLVTGTTFATQDPSSTTAIAFLAAVLGTIAMWWLYFDTGAERAHQRISHSDDPRRQARSAYTYLHALIVGGIIVSAAADEILLVHPLQATDPEVAAILGGPLLYLFGNALFKWVTNDRLMPPLSHLAGLALLGALLPPALGGAITPLVAGVLATAILVLVATWESMALRRTARAK